MQRDKHIWLRRLVPTDIDPVVAFAGRAFDNISVAGEIQAMLDIYCKSGAYLLRMDQQDTMLPAVYYLLVDGDLLEEHRIGLTGLYTTMWAGKGAFWLGWFAVDPAFQGLGYGYLLLKATLELAAARGGRLLSIETAGDLDAALGLYHRMGFICSGEVPDYWAPGSNLLILTRSLDDIPIPPEIPNDF